MSMIIDNVNRCTDTVSNHYITRNYGNKYTNLYYTTYICTNIYSALSCNSISLVQNRLSYYLDQNNSLSQE